MTQFVAGSIPRIDRSVEHVGISRLRKLNSDDLKTMEKTLVLQENDQPLAVLLTYEKFLVLQDLEGLAPGESQLGASAGSFEELYDVSPTFRMLADDQGVVILDSPRPRVEISVRVSSIPCCKSCSIHQPQRK